MNLPPLRTIDPPSRFNDDILMDQQDWNVLNKHARDFQFENYQHPLILKNPNDAGTRFNSDFLRHALIYVITETAAEYPYPCFSEKTWKAITSCVPFMIVGPKNSIKTLQNFGFCTFSKWWDESYDNQTFVTKRIQIIAKELKRLSRLNQPELNKIRVDMQEILQYNYHHLKTFTSNDLDNFRKKLYNTIND